MFFVDGPNEVNISRYEETVNIYEGMQFGPYTCSADCNPHCTLNWKANLTGKFKTIQSESVLNIANIGRNQTGTYRCKATNKINERGKRKDMMVTVECEYLFHIRYIVNVIDLTPFKSKSSQVKQVFFIQTKD